MQLFIYFGIKHYGEDAALIHTTERCVSSWFSLTEIVSFFSSPVIKRIGTSLIDTNLQRHVSNLAQSIQITRVLGCHCRWDGSSSYTIDTAEYAIHVFLWVNFQAAI